jgi:hypothetical protein
MAIVVKPLGQAEPSAATLTTLYTAPASTEAISSTLIVCNLSATATSFRVAFRPLGASIINEHYCYYDVIMPGNDTFASTVGMSFQATDVLSVYATLATLTFSLFGQEITA